MEMFSFNAGAGEIQLVEGDITKIAVDAIVNAANSALAGGGGVDGAIHRAGGPEIMRELAEIRRQIGSCPAGKAVVTEAGALPAKYVLHAVGPVYRGGQAGERQLLESCYRTCLDLAAERNLESISFPSISTGAYGYPVIEGAQVALEAVSGWLRKHAGGVKIIKLVQFGASDHGIYVRLARKMGTDSEGLSSTARM
jgi:O-acetyl-ADP-ribose deacetylase (regulator of RNase III)